MVDEEEKPSRSFSIGATEIKEKNLVQTSSGWYLHEAGQYYKIKRGQYGDEYEIEGKNLPLIRRKGDNYASADGQKIYGDASFLEEKSTR